MALRHKHWYSPNPPQLPLHFTDQPCGGLTSPVEVHQPHQPPPLPIQDCTNAVRGHPLLIPTFNLPFANVGIGARFYNAQVLNKCTNLSPSTELQFTSHPLHFTPLYTITNRPAINLPLLPFFFGQISVELFGIC